MEFLGEYNNRKAYWWNYSKDNLADIYEGNWIVFALETVLPDFISFEKFANRALDCGILEFKAFGIHSSELDDWFDEIVVFRNEYDSQKFDVMTTWHTNETVADAFWQCFHATCISDEMINENLQILCFHFNIQDQSEELKMYLQKFKQGWIPE